MASQQELLPFREVIANHIRNLQKQNKFSLEEAAILKLLWTNWGKSLTQRDLARSEGWLGCHPKHEQDIVNDEWETTLRQVRQIIRDLRVNHYIPIISTRAGYKLPATREDQLEYASKLKKQVKAVIDSQRETYRCAMIAIGLQPETV